MSSNNNTSNFNQAVWLGIGQLCTFAIAFLTAPIMARYFDKVEYATYKQILYVYTSLQSLFTMGLPSVFAYFIPRINEQEQKYFINRLTMYFLIIGAVFSISLYFSADLLARLMNNPELALGLKIFSPFPLFTLPAMGVEGIYNALRKAKYLAFYHVFTKILMFLCIILPVIIWHTGYKEAIMGWGAASFITFLVAMYMKNSPYRGIKAETIPNVDKKIFNYSLPLTGAFIAGFFCNSADQFFVSRYYGTQVFADFINGCFSIPIVGMVAGSVKGVLLPLFSKADEENAIGNAISSYVNAVKNSATIIAPMLLFCLVFSSDVVIALFGEKYAASSSYLRIFILRDFVSIFPYFAILMAFGFSKLYMNMHTIGAVAIWALDFVIIQFGAPSQLIMAVSTTFHIMCSVAAFIYIFKKKEVNFFNGELRSYLSRMFSHCMIVLAILFAIALLLSSINVFVKLILFASAYYLIIILTGKLMGVNYLTSVERLISSHKKK